MKKEELLKNVAIEGAITLTGKTELVRDTAKDIVALAYSLQRMGINIELTEITKNIASLLYSLSKTEQVFRNGFYAVNPKKPNRPSTNFATVPQNSAKASFSKKAQNNKMQNEKTK